MGTLKKFRIWDESNQKFDYLDFENISNLIIVLKGYKDYFNLSYLNSEGNKLHQYCRTYKEVDFYEGDIITEKYDTTVKRIIKFNEETGFYGEDIDKIDPIPEWVLEEPILLGNIYQNPDLLKKEENDRKTNNWR